MTGRAIWGNIQFEGGDRREGTIHNPRTRPVIDLDSFLAEEEEKREGKKANASGVELSLREVF